MYSIFDQMMFYPAIPLLEVFWTILPSVLRVRHLNTLNYTYLTYSAIFDSSMYVCIYVYRYTYDAFDTLSL